MSHLRTPGTSLLQQQVCRGLRSLFSWTCIWLAAAAVSAAAGLRIRHDPQQPKSDEAVTFAVTGEDVDTARPPLLEYQVVEPGHYVARSDATFEKNWIALSLTADPTRAKTLRAKVPESVQKHRRLIRYRLLDTKDRKPLLPASAHSVPNFAYYVYDGVPAWSGAIKPNGSGSERTPITFPAEVMRRVPSYQFIADRAAVEAVTWKPSNRMGWGNDRHEYRYTGTMVVDGIVYDHVRFRARGGIWRYAMGKNMWKFDFAKGHHLAARDDFARPYPAKWSKLNLGACFQQGSFGYRGEHGVVEAATYRMFNLAGVAAPRTHWVQLRMVTDPAEASTDQYRGDYWGLYLAVENVDEDFSSAHGLPDASVFKIEGMQPDGSHLSPKGATLNEASAFIRSLRSPGVVSPARIIDQPDYYSYRSIVESAHHYDLDAGKNYFFYRHPETRLWRTIPWDVDLTWGEHMYGWGNDPFLAAGALQSPTSLQGYRNRLRELRDLLVNADQANALLDELAGIIGAPPGEPSPTEADRRLWDHHPILSSRFVMPHQATPGAFYENSPSHDFAGMIQMLKSYLSERSRWIDRTLLAKQSIPAVPKIVAGSGARQFQADVPSGGSVQWHLGDVTSPATGTQGPREYEVVPVWVTNGSASIELPAGVLMPGHVYRLRARLMDAAGNAGHYSSPTPIGPSR
ncbi:MAG: hypothetical protein EXS36_13290 [Pedosphaera sp.]|nr:hypothetical protein [Pedosphaera sp.]